MYFAISDWFAAFVLTLVVEVPIVLALVDRLRPDRIRAGVIVVFANLATHLAVWYVATQLLEVGSVAYVLVAESWAILAEALIYWAGIPGLSARRALGIAGVANVASFAIGRAAAALWPGGFS